MTIIRNGSTVYLLKIETYLKKKIENYTTNTNLNLYTYSFKTIKTGSLKFRNNLNSN